MGTTTKDVTVAQVRAMDDSALATMIRWLAFDIPRMQALLALARREVRQRKRAARAPATPTPPGERNDRAAIAGAGGRDGRGMVSATRETGRGSSLAASDAGNPDRDFCVVSGPGSY